jgi:DNA invertase Pin-like site-specific DNA recombinase
MTRAVIYVRESKDQWGDERAVDRFEETCLRLCGQRGLRVVASLRDNDVRASTRNRGKGFAEVLRMIRDREADYVVIPVMDRFFRNLRDLEDIIELCMETGVVLVAASGEIDLSHDQGRLTARLLTSVSKAETERKAARQRDANEQAARAGQRFIGCPRPFGYGGDHITPEPAEAAAVQWAADALLGGATISAVMREWQRRGLRPPQAPYGPLRKDAWSRSTVTTIMRNPRLAGLSALPRRPDPADRPELDTPPRKHKRMLPAEITGPGNWTPVLPEPTWRAVAALLADPARKPPLGVRTLLGGLARCLCGNIVTGSVSHLGQHVYRCQPSSRDGRPGPHVAVRAELVDEFVEEVLIERLSRADVAELLSPPKHVDTSALRSEAAAIRRNLDELAADRAAGLISRSQLLAATERGNARLAEISTRLAESTGRSVLTPFMRGVKAAVVWADLDDSRRRAVIATLCTVTLHPAGRGARVYDCESKVEFGPPTV